MESHRADLVLSYTRDAAGLFSGTAQRSDGLITIEGAERATWVRFAVQQIKETKGSVAINLGGKHYALQSNLIEKIRIDEMTAEDLVL